ncbi:MAG: restriction endonuclease [Aquabacterium sp.]
MSEQLQRIGEEALAYFLCEYSPQSPKKKLEVVLQEYLAKHYSSEVISNFFEKRLHQFRSDLVEEYNSRIATDSSIRFDIVDPLGEGHIVTGRKTSPADKRITFQDALQSIDPNKFEDLAAIVLKQINCEIVFRTPRSHDQGVDAFGYRGVAPALSRAVSHKLVWIAQAKHYITHGVSTNAVRELVGTNELLVSKIFSTVDERYKELRLLPYAPTALLLMTTHEMPSTVRRLAERAGIYVFEASDLYDLLNARLAGKGDAKAALLRLIDSEILSIPSIS